MGPSVAGVAGGLVLLAAVFAVLERWRPAVPAQGRWRLGTGTDLVYWFFTPLVTKLVTRVGIVLGLVGIALALGMPIDREHLEGLLVPRPEIARQPFWVQLLGFLLVTDLVAYAMHRLFHHRPLWRFHAVHHSSKEIDWLSSVRLHPVNDVLMRVAQAVPVVLLGFDPRLLAAYVPLLAFYAVFVHANLAWGFGPLRFVVASPAFHRWHHAAEEEGLDRNFAGLFPFIDLLFGTFHLPPDRLPSRFGIPGIEPTIPGGFLAQLVHPFRRAPRPAAIESEPSFIA